MTSLPRIHGFLGKGGVGKTTLSLALGQALAASGRNTRVVSLDPAHNLGDLVGASLKDCPTKVSPHLFLQEVDLEKRSEAFRDELRQTLSTRFPRMAWLARPLKEAMAIPGDEETAFLRVLDELFEGPEDFIILDMPPTGLSLRVFRWAHYRKTWVESLKEWRGRILQERRRMNRLWNRTQDIDPLYERLTQLERIQTSRWERLMIVHWWVIMTPDPLAREEAQRILQRLKDLGIHQTGVIRNQDPTGIPHASDPIGAARAFWSKFLCFNPNS